MQSLQALRPCWQSEGCLQGLIESVPALQLWITGLAMLEQRAPYVTAPNAREAVACPCIMV